MKRTDQNRLNNSRRLLYWGTPLLSLLVWPPLLFLLFEQSWGLNALFTWRGALGPPDGVVVVALDEDSDALLDRPDRRAVYAGLIDNLSRAGASIIVLDLFLEQESSQDTSLADRLRNSRNVILTARLDDRDLQVEPVVDVLARNALAIAPFPVPAIGFRVDWIPLRFDLPEGTRYSIPFVALQAFAYDEAVALLQFIRPDEASRYPNVRNDLPLNASVNQIVSRFAELFANESEIAPEQLARLDNHRNAVRSLVRVYQERDLLIGNRMYLNYYGPPRTVTTISIEDVLAGRFDANDATSIEGKAVFVGLSAIRQQEQYDDNPYVYSTEGLNISGVELGATAFANLLHGDALRIWPASLRTALLLFWGLIVAFSFSILSVRKGAVVAILLFAGYLLFASILFQNQNLWLPVVVPAIQLMFAGLFSLRVKQLGEIRDSAMLEKGMSREAAEAARGRGNPSTVDDRIILYCDQKGSTAWLLKATENLAGNERSNILSEYDRAWLGPIERFGGEVNRPVTDSAQAFWRVPQDNQGFELAANSACRAVLTMHDGIAVFNRKRPGYELPVRFGLDCSEILTQWIPEPFAHWRLDGMAVNTSVRLESLNKLLDTWILVSGRIADQLDRNEFWSPRLGVFEFYNDDGVKEVNRVAVHALDFATNVGPEQKELSNDLETAQRAIEEQDWITSIGILEQLDQSMARGDLISRYLSWSRQSLNEAARCRWNGVIKVTLSSKNQALERLLI